MSTLNTIPITEYLPVETVDDNLEMKTQLICKSCRQTICTWSQIEYSVHKLPVQEIIKGHYQTHMQLSPQCVRRRINVER